MKKDLKWFKKELDDIENNTPALHRHDAIWMLDRVHELYNQLDEPEVKQLYEKIEELESYNDELIRDNNQLRNEIDNQEVLSREWVKGHEQQVHPDHPSNAWWVPSDDLQNLLVPKQELPEIPKFVAELLRRNKKDNFKLIDTYAIALERGSWADRKLVDWLQEDWTREDIFARAWLDGYTLEEEPRYRIKTGNNYIIIKNDGSTQTVRKDNAVITKERLEQLPFDVDKAVESGIIEVEELEE